MNTNSEKEPRVKSRDIIVGRKNAWVYFCQENTGDKKELSQRWRAMTPDERAPYDAKAAADRKRYDSEFAQLTAEQKGHLRKTRKRKRDKKSGPKRALSAYMQFSKAVRASVVAQNSKMTFAEIGRRVGEMWKALSEDGRAPYKAMYEKEKKQYEEARAAAKAQPSGEEPNTKPPGGEWVVVTKQMLKGNNKQKKEKTD